MVARLLFGPSTVKVAVFWAQRRGFRRAVAGGDANEVRSVRQVDAKLMTAASRRPGMVGRGFRWRPEWEEIPYRRRATTRRTPKRRTRQRLRRKQGGRPASDVATPRSRRDYAGGTAEAGLATGADGCSGAGRRERVSRVMLPDPLSCFRGEFESRPEKLGQTSKRRQSLPADRVGNVSLAGRRSSCRRCCQNPRCM